jgi:aldose 1-epimerase
MNFYSKRLALIFLCAAAVTIFSPETPAQIKERLFGKTSDGHRIDLYTLTNKNGVEAKIINYGARIVSIKVPDRRGKTDDVVLGFDDFASYQKDDTCMGCIAGRYANRIAKGRFTHGGVRGFDKAVWAAQPNQADKTPRVRLTYRSPDKEENYPGNLTVSVSYLLTDENELKIEYEAATDRETILNLTSHAYFNLAGAGRGDILKHELKINAELFTETDSGLIPNGKLLGVKGTPLDFRRPQPIGARIEEKFEPLGFGAGYDHNYVLDKPAGALGPAAEVYEPSTGRVMEVLTTEPGLQFYTGNFLNDVAGKGGKIYRKRDGFCLEAQHFPDSPNHPAFPSTVLKPGGRYTQTTVYKFSVRPKGN